MKESVPISVPLIPFSYFGDPFEYASKRGGYKLVIEEVARLRERIILD